MIQRIQSIWLFLAAACSALTFRFPFFSGNIIDKNNISKFEDLDASFNLLFTILTVILTAGLLYIIFIFKNRKRQFRLSIASLLAFIFLLVLYFYKFGKFTDGNLALTSVIYFASPVFIILAAINIKRDENLIKSMDRLR